MAEQKNQRILPDLPPLRLPPHSFLILGRVIKVRYGDPSGDVLDCKTEWGAYVHADSTIYLNPELRRLKHRGLIWEILAHELLHVLDETRTKWDGYRPITHRAIEHLSIPLGSFLAGVLGVAER